MARPAESSDGTPPGEDTGRKRHQPGGAARNPAADLGHQAAAARLPDSSSFATGVRTAVSTNQVGLAAYENGMSLAAKGSPTSSCLPPAGGDPAS